ncbi:MAG TPA: FkbM family methyltransferase [Pirellulales bacterium]|nr:FkbM family methyltransferase [Pirellulales bacterium]HEX4146451.1 FkbM family methyltransferase [Pirellulales bacterium]
MISYAQNGEDVVLMRAFADVKDGFYVDVGAWDPVIYSVTKCFYDAGWRGLNLEPQPDLCALLNAQRPRDINLPIAASDADGLATLWVTKHSPLSTINRSIIDPNIADYAIVQRVETRTAKLSRILDDHAGERDIHFLKIDVEGHEAEVLCGVDFNRHRPIVLVIEATCPITNAPIWPKWESIVLDAGYQFALFDGLNRFYVCKERTDLLPTLSHPANCLDRYLTHRESQLQARLEAVDDELCRVRSELAKATGRVSSPTSTS